MCRLGDYRDEWDVDYDMVCCVWRSVVLVILFAALLCSAGCGPTLKNVDVRIELPPGTVIAEGQKVAPIQINIGNRETHIDTARGLSATIPSSAAGL